MAQRPGELEPKYLKSFKMLQQWREKIELWKEISNEVLEYKGEKRTFLNIIMETQIDWTYAKRKLPSYNVFLGQMMEVK